ncbi:LacI family DNA-binding transcriptional regulator [Nocardia jiangxiensis]|uniref:LacI family DNA-binding transcriptional regulator n=1 Tax=Nocardia jiangxiensis TaxID=282685 RepID=A0ABW6RVB5_9NOCA
MGYAKPRKGYCEAHYAIGNGQYEVLRDTAGKPVRFPTKRLAQQEANHWEVKRRNGEIATATPEPPPVAHAGTNAPGNILFQDWVELWYEEQDLARTSMATYKSILRSQLLPEFGGKPLNEITKASITRWVRKLREAGYKPESIRTYRSLLHTILEDAHTAHRIAENPARRTRGRGRRIHANRGQEKRKVLAQGSTALLIAERMALLSGKDDEFVLMILANYSGMRLGELIGLETQFVPTDTPAERAKTRHTLRVHWQLCEIDGKFYKEPLKENSRRDIDLPHFLWLLLIDQINRTQPVACPCHSSTYVFAGQSKRRSKGSTGGLTLKDVAQSAGVSVGTASSAFRKDTPIAPSTRAHVIAAAEEIGYLRWTGDAVWHQRRSGPYRWIYTPAVSGQYPKSGTRSARPVWIRDDPFPGVPIRGRNAAQRANSYWQPIAEGMTPHGNRHTHRTDLEELAIPQVLIDDRIGHLDRSVQRRYTQPTNAMRDHLVTALTQRWHDALDARLAISPTSPVKVLDTLLKERAAELANKPAA